MGSTSRTASDARWKFRAPRDNGRESFYYCAPCLWEGTAFANATAGGPPLLSAIDIASRRERWSFRTSTYAWSSAAIAGDMIIVGDYFGTIQAVRLSDGKPQWTYKAPSAVTTPLTPADGVIHFGDDKGNVYAIR